MSRKKEPLWLALLEVLAVHEMLLALHGGAIGIRDRGLLESALGRPQNSWAYERADLFALAAAYADGIANNHPFIDGNKRTAFIAAALFLETNGYEFIAPEEEVVAMTLALADKTLPPKQYARWLQDRSVPRLRRAGEDA